MGNGILIHGLRIRKETVQLTTDSHGQVWTAFDLTNCISINPDTTVGSNSYASKMQANSVSYPSGVVFIQPYDGSRVANKTFNCDFYFLETA